MASATVFKTAALARKRFFCFNFEREKSYASTSNFFSWFVQDVMAFQWQERVHDVEDIAAWANVDCCNAMRACGFMKFFLTPRLRAQHDLLELLIRAWNPVDMKFTIWGQDIEFDHMDIFFLTGLSRRGARPIIEGQ